MNKRRNCQKSITFQYLVFWKSISSFTDQSVQSANVQKFLTKNRSIILLHRMIWKIKEKKIAHKAECLVKIVDLTVFYEAVYWIEDFCSSMEIDVL